MRAIWQIEDSSFTDPYPHNLLAKLLREYPDTFFVAETSAGTIVGYCVAAQQENWAHLISIGVLPEYRRRRIGTALIHALLGTLAPEVGELRLEVKQGNAEAIKLYEDLGFRPVNLIENYYEDGSSAVKTRLNLPQNHQGPPRKETS